MLIAEQSWMINFIKGFSKSNKYKVCLKTVTVKFLWTKLQNNTKFIVVDLPILNPSVFRITFVNQRHGFIY